MYRGGDVCREDRLGREEEEEERVMCVERIG